VVHFLVVPMFPLFAVVASQCISTSHCLQLDPKLCWEASQNLSKDALGAKVAADEAAETHRSLKRQSWTQILRPSPLQPQLLLEWIATLAKQGGSRQSANWTLQS
jgi:hypothetical protein